METALAHGSFDPWRIVRTKLRSKHNLHQIASDTISENEPVTLDFFIRDYLDHLKKHLGQILD